MEQNPHIACSYFLYFDHTQIDLSLQRFLHSTNLSSDAGKKEITGDSGFNKNEDVLKSMEVV